MEKVYKVYFLWNNEKVYIRNHSGTETYVTLRGAKAAIAQREKIIKHCGNTPTSQYFIEEYKCELVNVLDVI